MIKSMRIPLSKPALLDPDIESAVNIIKSGRLVSGRTVETFERQLATYVKTEYAVCVSSGTAALHLGLLALGIRPGDDVIVPAFSYPASANAVEVVGARPIFIDSEPNGFNVDVSEIENNITSRTRAIMIVHNFGWPVEINKIHALSAKYNIPVIEDAACALGSSIGSVRCGNLGRLGIFSFHPRKIMTTGEGGAVVTNDLQLAEEIRKLRNHGQDISRGVDFVMPGFNYRMTDFQAALGVSQMKRFDSILLERSKTAGYYHKNLNGMEFLRPCVPGANRRLNYQTYVAFVPRDHRDKLIDHLKGYDIEAGIGTYSIPHTTYYSTKYGIDKSRYPESLSAFRNLISLPLYGGITNDEQDNVMEALKKYKADRKGSRIRQTVETS
ncbi:MAG: DegT/DnrJ/EryC1/StrS family aminotransferase [Candidatus Zixiibacteriota bacterium]|nr:MAG: DegT/DnrJ/EryC1/StrS family aminotransferase [candidate division Zixibacteria bacterium]